MTTPDATAIRDVQKYKLVYRYGYQSQMVVRPDGSWVKHGDYLSLCDALDELRAENDRGGYAPCGGCGAKTPDDRCIGCLHDFGDPPQPSAPVAEAMKHLHDIINCGNCSGSRQSARLALGALAAMETGHD